jgi:uncharacterized Rmd1/YagE family protein
VPPRSFWPFSVLRDSCSPSAFQSCVFFSSTINNNSASTSNDVTTGNGAGASSSSLPTRRRKGPTLPLEFSESLIPVSPIHVAKTIDLEAAAKLFPDATKVRKKNSYIIRLETYSDLKNPSYLAVYPYGSLVFFNVKPSDIATIVQQLKPVTTKPYFDRSESYSVLVTKDVVERSPLTAQDYDRFHIVNGDFCIVPELEWNAVSVIANIMAQTVALDSYADTVDELLDNFAGINLSVAETGSFNGKDLLFQTIARNNSIFIDMISKIRILDKSDTAWNLIQYEKIHYGLKEEFEIDDRFENIEFKLNLIEKNAKFFMEVMHSQKSSNLEWTIALLIGLECFLMCVEMSGCGEPLFRAWTSGYLWPPEWIVADGTDVAVAAAGMEQETSNLSSGNAR